MSWSVSHRILESHFRRLSRFISHSHSTCFPPSQIIISKFLFFAVNGDVTGRSNSLELNHGGNHLAMFYTVRLSFVLDEEHALVYFTSPLDLSQLMGCLL
jgi:hypothetical protein